MKNWLRKDPDAGKDWRQEEKGTTENEMVGWHHWLNGHEFEEALAVGDRQGSLACCSPWSRRVGHNWATELNCPTLCDSLDSSPPASFARGIFQARLLEWIAISFSRGTSRLRDWTKVSCAVDNLLHCRQILYQLSHQETWSLTENNKILYSYYPSIKK